eukprot:6481656-Amphidinium_carterae.1
MSGWISDLWYGRSREGVVVGCRWCPRGGEGCGPKRSVGRAWRDRARARAKHQPISGHPGSGA